MIILDINLTGYLQAHGITPELKKQPDGRVVFCFSPNERFFELQDRFNSDPELQAFVTSLKRVRGRMLALRDDETNGNGNYRNGSHKKA